MTSMAVAPRPIIIAQKNPRRAPSFMIVRLIGPTGTDKSRPLINPVTPASRIVWRSVIPASLRQQLVGFFFVLFLDFTADFSGNARTDEPIQQIKGEESRQCVIEN